MTTKSLLIFLAFFALPSFASAAIELDKGGVTVNNTTNPITLFQRGATSTNYIAIVELFPSSSSRTVSGVWYCGVAMTQLWGIEQPLAGAGGIEYMYYLVNPSTANCAVTASTTAQYYMSVSTFNGVDQSTPFDPTVDGGSANYEDTNCTTVTTCTLTINSSINGSVGVGGWTNSASGASTGGTNTVTYPVNMMRSTTPIAVAGDFNMIISDVSQNWSMTGSVLQPAAASTPPTVTQPTQVIFFDNN